MLGLQIVKSGCHFVTLFLQLATAASNFCHWSLQFADITSRQASKQIEKESEKERERKRERKAAEQKAVAAWEQKAPTWQDIYPFANAACHLVRCANLLISNSSGNAKRKEIASY